MSKEQFLMEQEEKLEEITEAWFKQFKTKDELIDYFWEYKINSFERRLGDGDVDIDDLYREYVE